MAADMSKLDSTDRLPAYEMYVRNHGEDLHPVTMDLGLLMLRMTAYVRRAYKDSCPACHLCTILLRRYRATERMHVHSHFDRNAVVSAVVSLNGGRGDFDGARPN